MENFSTKTMTFTLFWVSSSLHRRWFSPLIWIQEKVLSTDNGFSLKSDFMKKFSTQTIPLCLPILHEPVHCKFRFIFFLQVLRALQQHAVPLQVVRLKAIRQYLKSESGIFMPVIKLDGVGPVDYRPSTDKLHHFVRKKTKKTQKNT